MSWRKILLGCGGCLAAGITGFVVLALFGGWLMSRTTTQDPQKVRQMAAEILPGSEPPAPFVPENGLTLGQAIVSFEDKAGAWRITLQAVAKSPPNQNPATYDKMVRDTLKLAGNAFDPVTEDMVLDVGGNDIPAVKISSEQSHSVRYLVVVRRADTHAPVAIMVKSDRKALTDQQMEQMRAYLHGLKVEGPQNATPVPGAAATKTP